MKVDPDLSHLTVTHYDNFLDKIHGNAYLFDLNHPSTSGYSTCSILADIPVVSFYETSLYLCIDLTIVKTTGLLCFDKIFKSFTN
jgi:hypothetical protein